MHRSCRNTHACISVHRCTRLILSDRPSTNDYMANTVVPCMSLFWKQQVQHDLEWPCKPLLHPAHTHRNRCAGSQDSSSSSSSSSTQLEGTEKNGSHHHYPLSTALPSHFLYTSFVRWPRRLSHRGRMCLLLEPPPWRSDGMLNSPPRTFTSIWPPHFTCHLKPHAILTQNLLYSQVG